MKIRTANQETPNNPYWDDENPMAISNAATRYKKLCPACGSPEWSWIFAKKQHVCLDCDHIKEATRKQNRKYLFVALSVQGSMKTWRTTKISSAYKSLRTWDPNWAIECVWYWGPTTKYDTTWFEVKNDDWAGARALAAEWKTQTRTMRREEEGQRMKTEKNVVTKTATKTATKKTIETPKETTMKTATKKTATKKTATKKTATKKTAKKAAPKRTPGTKSGLGVQATWVSLFEKNESLAKNKKLTDEQITSALNTNFPGKNSAVFGQVQQVRAKYNRGGFNSGTAPKVQSHRYDDKGVANDPARSKTAK